MCPLDLGERLRVEVVVKEGDPPFLLDEEAPLAPSGQLRNEVRRTGQFDVDAQALLERRERAEQTLLLRGDLQVHIDGGRSPAQKHGRRASCEVDAHLRGGSLPQGLHEPLEAPAIGQFAHSRALSKLTRVRMRAL